MRKIVELNRLAAFTCLVAVSCAGGRVAVPTASVERRDAGVARGDGLVVAEGIPGDQVRTIDEILLSVVLARGLEPLDSVVARGVSREEHLSFVKKEIADPRSARMMDTVEALLKATGSMKDDASLAGYLEAFMVDDVVGYYDWERRAMFVGDWGDLPSVSAVIAHELTHMLQDQHFGLGRMVEPVEGISEPFAAGLAVAEGDASLLMLAVEGGAAGFSPPVVEAFASIMDSEWDRDAAERDSPVPPVISEMLKFPYVYGVRYVGRLLSAGEGGWAGVDAALKSPPLSTEQVIHPEAAADYPMNVCLPVAPAPDLDAAGSDIVGEAGFLAVFRDVMPRADADAAAAGWDGDRFGVWTRADGTKAVILASVWDTPADANEAGRAIMRLRAVPAAIRVSGNSVLAVWGLPPDVADSTARQLTDGLETIEIRAWDDWLKYGTCGFSPAVGAPEI